MINIWARKEKFLSFFICYYIMKKGDTMFERYQIRLALLEADVNYQVVKEFIKNVKEKAQ